MIRQERNSKLEKISNRRLGPNRSYGKPIP